MTHDHREAFALMTYESDDGAERVTIWNSRDGVAPFVVTLPSGREARHVDWRGDVYAPDHNPKLGDLVFVTDYPSLDFWRGVMRKRVESYPQAAPPEGSERDEFVEQLARSAMSDQGEAGTVAMKGWGES